jgi:hypothetical protein
MSEVGDVIDLLWGFERQNKVFLSARLETVLEQGKVDLKLTVGCYSDDPELPEAKYLGSSSATCSGMNLKTFRDALTRVLYMLDGQLAEDAFAETVKNKA